MDGMDLDSPILCSTGNEETSGPIHMGYNVMTLLCINIVSEKTSRRQKPYPCTCSNARARIGIIVSQREGHSVILLVNRN